MHKIAIGWDPNAVAIKDSLVTLLKERRYTVDELGSDDPIYANSAIKVAEAVANGDYDRGVLLCGTGIGMSIAANKVRGAYAALIPDVYSAKRARMSNDANIACFGAFTQGSKLIEELALTFLTSEFDQGGSSQPKVERYRQYDQNR